MFCRIVRATFIVVFRFVLRLFLNYVFRLRLHKHLKLWERITSRSMRGKESEFVELECAA